jgi:hypothetical protein
MENNKPLNLKNLNLLEELIIISGSFRQKKLGNIGFRFKPKSYKKEDPKVRFIFGHWGTSYVMFRFLLLLFKTAKYYPTFQKIPQHWSYLA